MKNLVLAIFIFIFIFFALPLTLLTMLMPCLMPMQTLRISRLKTTIPMLKMLISLMIQM